MPKNSLLVKGRSVTGHEVIVFGIRPSNGHLVGELLTRSCNKWTVTEWDADGYSSGESKRSLDLASVGLEPTPANTEMLQKYAGYQSKYASEPTVDQLLATVDDGEADEGLVEDEGDE